MVTAIRRTLDQELEINPRVLLFGEDIGPKGGVHAVTLGLQEKYGAERVFDTSLSEEGIIGRAVGMALAGLMPVPEIQFRKYAEPAPEQINDCGTMRWRTNNRFAAPMVLRMPIGFFKCGDPWHSQTNEVQFVHNPGWLVAAPSNAEDAVGLLRSALRGNDPIVFFEHRAMLEEDDRVVAAQGRAEQADRILGIGRRRDQPAGIVDELHLVGLAMPGIAAFEEADRHAQHHRRGEAVVGAPAHRPAIVDLLGRGLGIFAELDFRHRHQPGERHADGAADDPFLVEAGVEDPLGAVLLLQAQGHRVDAALRPDILAEQEDARVDLQLVVERPADRGDHVDPLAFGPRRLGECGAR